MPKKVIIFGCSEIAKICFSYLQATENIEVVGFTMDTHYMKDDSLLGLPIFSYQSLKSYYPPSQADMFVAFSYSRMNENRIGIHKRIKNDGYSFINIVHPSSTVESNCINGENILIMENVVVQPSCEINNNVIIGPNSSICHDTSIKNGVYISPLVCLCGYNIVGEQTVLGSCSVVSPRIKIGKKNYIGIGCRITQNSADNASFFQPSTPESGVDSSVVSRIEFLKY